uniref:Chitin-binding type-2 domain-containing protein n=1 Tax=Macrostomum lignano TaxID=282301 RepID=A0A1I8JNJ3_9PLAT
EFNLESHAPPKSRKCLAARRRPRSPARLSPHRRRRRPGRSSGWCRSRRTVRAQPFRVRESACRSSALPAPWQLQVGGDRLLLTCRSRAYRLDFYLPVCIDQAACCAPSLMPIADCSPLLCLLRAGLPRSLAVKASLSSPARQSAPAPMAAAPPAGKNANQLIAGVQPLHHPVYDLIANEGPVHEPRCSCSSAALAPSPASAGVSARSGPSTCDAAPGTATLAERMVMLTLTELCAPAQRLLYQADFLLQPSAAPRLAAAAAASAPRCRCPPCALPPPLPLLQLTAATTKNSAAAAAATDAAAAAAAYLAQSGGGRRGGAGNPVGELQELCQRRLWPQAAFHFACSPGRRRHRQFVCTASLWRWEQQACRQAKKRPQSHLRRKLSRYKSPKNCPPRHEIRAEKLTIPQEELDYSKRPKIPVGRGAGEAGRSSSPARLGCPPRPAPRSTGCSPAFRSRKRRPDARPVGRVGRWRCRLSTREARLGGAGGRAPGFALNFHDLAAGRSGKAPCLLRWPRPSSPGRAAALNAGTASVGARRRGGARRTLPAAGWEARRRR